MLRQIALPFILVLLAGCHQADEAAPISTYHQQVRVEPVVMVDSYDVEREFSGLALPRQSSQLGFQRAGEITTIAVDEGDAVAAGQIVARQDTRLLAAEREQWLARIENLESQVGLNRSSTDRLRQLNDQGFASNQRMDELAAESGSLQAEIAELKAALESNAAQLQDAVLKAPYAGTVVVRHVDQGAAVQAGEPVLQLIQDGGLEARVGVPVRLAEGMRSGDLVRIEVGGTLVDGMVLTVGQDVARATLTLPVRISIPAIAPAVAGDQLYLRLTETRTADGFWIPMAAMTDGLRGLWNIYVATPANSTGLYRLEARDIRVHYASESQAFVSGAVDNGELVVAVGVHRLVPGLEVRLENPPLAGELADAR